jgi:hypothetical protein
MTGPTRWQTDDPCPTCGTTLTLTGDGSDVIRVECRSCGRADTWTTGQAPADEHEQARRAAQWLLAEYEQDAAAVQAKLDGRPITDAQYQRFKRIMSPGPMFTLREG